MLLPLPNQLAEPSSDDAKGQHETIKSGIHYAGAFVLLDGKRLRRPALHVDGCQRSDPYHQDPPPDTAKAVDTIDYLPQPNQPVRSPTANDLTNQQKGNLVQRSGQSGAESGSDLTSGDDTKQIQYEGDSYRRTLLRYEIKHKILDDNEPVKERDLPVKVQPNPTPIPERFFTKPYFKGVRA